MKIYLYIWSGQGFWRMAGVHSDLGLALASDRRFRARGYSTLWRGEALGR